MAPPPVIISISDDEVTASGDEADVLPSTSPIRDVKPRKRKIPSQVPEKIEWTDDDDELSYDTFKKRKIDEKPAKGKGKAKASERPAAKAAKGKPRVKVRPGDHDDPEENLPDYLKQRRRAFDQDRKRLQQAGLKLPPTYDDVDFSDDERYGRLEERPKFDEKSGVKPSRAYEDIVLPHSCGIIPAPIAQYLRDYQVEGVKFLHELFVYQKGGILGDDMGLGKTVQVAAFLTAMFGKTGDQRDAKRMRKFRWATDRWYPKVLIVCPGSLTQNWRQELDRWGWWATDLYHGAGKDDVLAATRAGSLEIMITTYTTYKNNQNAVNRVAWDLVVADECHCLKDPGSEVTKAMTDVNALCRIGLTGTAIQNKYEELWCILNWTKPGLFGTLAEWKHTISKPLTIGQSHDATIQQLSKARKTAKKLVENLLPQFFLRRMKSLIAHQLPKKSDRVVFCPLSEIQRKAYQNFTDSPLVEIVKRAYDDCECGSGNKRGFCCHEKTAEGESWKALVFPCVMSLQKLSSHLTLLIPSHSETKEKHDRDMRYLQAAMPDNWKTLYNQRESLLSLSNPDFCGKWAVLKKLLAYWHSNGDKVLVFSHSVRLLRILQYLFNNTSYNVSYLDGSLSYEDRQSTVDDFNTDSNQFVFLISTKAGGVGLNITSANKVVIMDPHWNPSYDLQAQDRAYRIGQVRNVEVYRLISAGTIEEITYARQIYKQQQANIGYTASNERRYFKGVQHQPDRKGEIFGIDNLLSYRPDEVKLRDIVNKTNIAEAKAGVSLMDVDMEQAVEEASQEGLIKKEEDPGNDNGGLGHLASLLTKQEIGDVDKKKAKARKSDVVQAILVSAGVEYTHENSEVVGSSKVEDRISRRAELEASQDQGETARAIFDSQDPGIDDADIETGNLSFHYNPPDDVKQRQFCTMAKTFGFPNATEFALAVETMTQEQRRNTLELFYTKRLERLRDFGMVKSENEGKLPVDAQDGVKDEVKPDIKLKPEDSKPDLRSEQKYALQATNETKVKGDGPGNPSEVGKNSIKTEYSKSASKNVRLTTKHEESPKALIWTIDDDDDDEL
ncbi:hypothetical protein PFICI_06623 [Pestalotiopsis fici W106-1]|uniref:DNA excision repair protein ERCC-6-like 2 n=1 Tax=Pestalotiopsis fici (strain W106-1 / CGMCC3.15140) TaxID=1229662 RepID=W3X8W6_PESFW|nr:uncharacterized protein PFICI_06623 [Pestalotiopsis fici W106-1]ETS81621.1 hypothetical protein PFICI_06623 [Pestalotiopsis fici W106-1]